MFNFLNRFLKPIDATELDNMPILDIAKINRRVSFNGKIVELTPLTVVDIVADRLQTLLKGMTDTEYSVMKDTPVHPSMYFTAKEFEKEVSEYVDEHKLYSDCYTYRGVNDKSRSAVLSELNIEYLVNTSKETNSILSVARDIAYHTGKRRESFENLKELGDKYQYLVPVVNYFNVNKGTEWYLNAIYITPEMLDGYIDAVRPVLDDEEALGKLREHVLKSFREAANGNPDAVDYNMPMVTVPTPDGWKRTYYGKVKPEEERRERNKAIIEEIRGSITEHDIMQEVGRRKLKAKLLALTDGEIAKTFPEDYREIQAIPV